MALYFRLSLFFCSLALSFEGLALPLNTIDATKSNKREPVKIYQFLKADELNMTPYRFRAYIKPQLRSINAEFYHILRKIRPNMRGLISLKESTGRFSERWNRWQSSCRTLNNEDCHKKLENLYERMRKIDAKLLRVQEDLVLQEKPHDGLFFLMQTMDEMMTMNFRLLHLLEQGLMLGQTILYLPKSFTHKVEKLVHQLNVRSEIILTTLLPDKYKEIFEGFWHNFIRPVERRILRKNSSQYLVRNLESLNADLNEFHMKVEKGRKRLPADQRKVADVMHNRWNTIMKVLLRDI